MRRKNETLDSIDGILNELDRLYALMERGIGDAPLLKNWWELTLRNRLRAAVDGGYDRLA